MQVPLQATLPAALAARELHQGSRSQELLLQAVVG